jgi:two-component system LytT family sensor kinase
VAPDQRYIIFSSSGRRGGTGPAGNLYISFRRADGTWEAAPNLGPLLNTDRTEFCPVVSPDGPYLYFTSDRSFAHNSLEAALSTREWNARLDAPATYSATPGPCRCRRCSRRSDARRGELLFAMTDGAMTPLSTPRAGAADALEGPPDASRRRGPSGYTLLNVGGWLLFGAAMVIGLLDVMPWEVLLATQPVYILLGFLLSLLLGLVYDWLGVGPSSFGRALAISVAGSYVAGVLWTFAFFVYRHFGAAIVHSVIIGAPSSLRFRREWFLDGALVNGALPLLGWSLVRLGLQYNTALREQREQALRAVAAARDAQLRMLAYQLNPHFLFNTLNSIRALINEDRQRARDMVTALSGFLRYAMVERPLHVALLEEEVESVRGYLAIEKVRFEERLDVRVDVEPAALRCEVPAFLLNPLVENAVKHGDPGTTVAPLVLRVEARLVEPDRLRLVVENTGRWAGEPTTAPDAGEGDDGLPGGVGLANVHARLAALHPGEHRIEIEEADGRVRVMVELPARYRTEAAT